jgi:signal transduction histidine kinase
MGAFASYDGGVSRFAPRQLLTDASLALVLVTLTAGPGLVSRSLGVQKSSLPTDGLWWMLAGLVVAGMLIRQPFPPAALVLTGLGTFGHLVLQTKFQLIDLALPLTLYTVATVAQRRRAALAVLGVVMALTYAAMLSARILEAQQASRSDKAAKELVVYGPTDKPVSTTTPVRAGAVFTDIAIDTSQSVLEMWLLLVAAFAVGDGTRSRRAHLTAVEQRTADQARQERQRAALAVAAERARITRELHDVVAHGISVMVVQAQGAAAAQGRHPERTATALQHVIDTGRSSLAEMRRLLAAGRTGPADDIQFAPLPGIGAVPALVDQLRSTGMRITLTIEGVPDVVPAAVDTSAYRIVQEALTNTLKHAGPDAGAWVGLEFDPDRLRVEVVDDGTGPAAGADGRGNGLRGIAERAAMLGGVVETGRGLEAGFWLCATLPLSDRMKLAVET